MAEYVQQTIEEMTNEVIQLERVGLFEKEETRKIIAKRKQHEYKLRRRIKTQQNYMDYIQYETNVLRLIAVRRKQNGYTFKREEIEGSILRRLLSLFHITCKNWPQDQDVWMARIKFVQGKMKSKSMASSLYSTMLQVITNKPNLWLNAAKYEFEHVYSMESARHVLIKGISFNKESHLLWHEYFRLECLLLDNINRRNEIAKVRALAAVDIPKYADDEFLTDEVKEGKVAYAVYSHARKAHPDDLSFAAGFVNIIKKFDFPFSDSIEDFIFTNLFESFSESADLWLVKANRFIDSVEPNTRGFHIQYDKAEDMCAKLMRKMLKKIDNEDSWSVYLAVNWRLLNLDRTEENMKRFLLSLTLVDQKGRITQSWMHKWIELVASHGDVSETVELFEKAVNKFPDSEIMWSSYIEYTALTTTQAMQTVSIFHRARKLLKQESLDLWQKIVTLSTGQLDTEEVVNLYEMAIASHKSVAASMKESYLNWTYLTRGISHARKLYKRLRQMVSGSEGLHKLYISTERAQYNDDLSKIRKAYRYMIEEYGSSSVDAWLEIIELEKNAGNVDQTSVLYSQAIRTLQGNLVEEFTSKQTIRTAQPSAR